MLSAFLPARITSVLLAFNANDALCSPHFVTVIGSAPSRAFISKWDVREVLDFISVRGLFQKGGADTKVVVILAEAATPPSDRKILHATFRRSGRVDAEQGFDIDYYDMHWLPRGLVLRNDAVWRTDLLGGGRVLAVVDPLNRNFHSFSVTP
ncbi:MAG: hypothetical protein ABSF15_07165 [Candidatus Sulfotelmatobacter sp.]|jgi:hypothetical protein